MLASEAVVGRCSIKKVFSEIFAKFTGKHLYQRLFLSANLLKKSLWHSCFSVKFAKFLRTPFFTEHLCGCFCGFLFRISFFFCITLNDYLSSTPPSPPLIRNSDFFPVSKIVRLIRNNVNSGKWFALEAVVQRYSVKKEFKRNSVKEIFWKRPMPESLF